MDPGPAFDRSTSSPPRALLVDFVRELRCTGDADLVRWCVAPTLLPAIGSADRVSRPRMSDALRNRSAWLPLRRGLEFRRSGGATFASQGGNPLRVLTAIEAEWQSRVGRSSERVRVHPRWGDLRRWDAASRTFEAEVADAARAAGWSLDRPAVTALASAAARSLARAEAALGGTAAPLVVATQHSIDVRAALAAARHQEITTVYFPHAPMETSPKYADLPIEHAGLRGEAERDHYRSIGARDALDVTGNPSVSVPLAEDALPPTVGRPIVLAVPARPSSELDALLAQVRSATDAAVVLCPHPRSDVEWLRERCPANWTIVTDRPTFDVLRGGAACVLQQSSGVAWESLALGLPTIELAPAGAAAYPFIAGPHVLVAPDVAALREALRSLDGGQSGPGLDRRALVDVARSWCATTGPEAASACADLVERAGALDGPRPLLLDTWGLPPA